MIKANVIIDYFKWKNKIKDPNNYFKKKLRKLSKILYIPKKKTRIFDTLNKQQKNEKLKF